MLDRLTEDAFFPLLASGRKLTAGAAARPALAGARCPTCRAW